MIRLHSDDSMNFKGFSLSYVAVDPLDEFDENSEIIDSSEVATPFPGYIPGGSGKFGKKEEDEEEGSEEIDEEDSELEKPDGKTRKIDEDLVIDNEDNYIYNSNRIGKENAVLMSSIKKKKDEMESF